jgi:hypothetical protein
VTDCANPSDFPGDGLIDRSETASMVEWSRILGVPEPEILIAVAVVGPSYAAVRAYLAGDELGPRP